MTRRFPPYVPVALAVTLALSGCAPQSASPVETTSSGRSCSGVTVTIDFASLGPAPTETCVEVSGETPALELLTQAGLTIEGTTQYGDAIACRVNGVPARDLPIHTQSGTVTEDCTDMPSADAYWSVWVRQNGAWDYAQVGLADLKLTPGDGLGLLFDIDNTVLPPAK